MPCLCILSSTSSASWSSTYYPLSTQLTSYTLSVLLWYQRLSLTYTQGRQELGYYQVFRCGCFDPCSHKIAQTNFKLATQFMPTLKLQLAYLSLLSIWDYRPATLGLMAKFYIQVESLGH